MKRVTALKVLSGTLVLIMLASAYPLGDVIVQRFSDAESATSVSSSTSGRDGASGLDLPFSGKPPSENERPDATTSGSSSRFQSPFSNTGSVLLDQMLGASRLMGHDVVVPDLPLAKLAPEKPLRPAILAWIAATGSVVPPEELAVELARADALPAPLQRDLAILLLSASEATLLQRAALADLTPEQIEWIYSHPEVADDLVKGISTPDTRTMAALAGLVKVEKSIQASLLMLQAVEATRSGLQSYSKDAAATDALAALPLDDETRAMLAHLDAGATMTAAGKIRFAAQLVALSAALPTDRAALPQISFTDALMRLLAATEQPIDMAEYNAVLERASLLPLDLQDALARILLAQSRAILAANPDVSTPSGQAGALVDTLEAAASALPVLEKYNLYWSAAPDALRTGQWDPLTRAQWAAESAGTLLSAGGHPIETARAAMVATGAPLVSPEVPVRSFADAFAALAIEEGKPATSDEIAAAKRAGDQLAPAVRDAAAILMSGAAEASRLDRVAWARVTVEERAFLFATDIDSLYAKSDITESEVATLRRAIEITTRVDREALAAAGIVGVDATIQARDILAGASAVQAQSFASIRETGWRAFFARFLPFGTASAQSAPAAPQPGCAAIDSPAGIILAQGYSFASDCQRDVYLRISVPTMSINSDLILITGYEGTTISPPTAQQSGPCEPGEQPTFTATDGQGNVISTRCNRMNPALGSSRVHLDLGGSDTYLLPVAMTMPQVSLGFTISFGDPGAHVRPSLHLDMGGDDNYVDPTSFVNTNLNYELNFGSKPHPTQASAYGGGVAVLVDADGVDRYDAKARSQGYARYGMGALIDLAGSDIYVGESFVQGASGEGLNIGVGLLYDVNGDDRYTAEAGMGYGYGGFLLDTNGYDVYTQEASATGVPVVKLQIVPGGDVTTLNARRDNSIWIDGPQGINLGVAIDRELSTNIVGDSDGDGDTDLAEFLSGSNPNDPKDTAEMGRARRTAAAIDDSDGDGWSDSLERAFSTDSKDKNSYPAGFPSFLPLPETPGGVPATGRPQGGGKILDLRVPAQDAGSVERPCVYHALNITLIPRDSGIVKNDEGKPDSACVQFAFDSSGKGQGNLTSPGTTTNTATSGGRHYNYSLPLGIFALGDTTKTTYGIDYFAVIDLGGDDTFNNAAGGSLPLEARDKNPPTSNSLTNPAIGTSYSAPSLVMSIDNSATATGNDRYLAPSGTPAFHNAQGSLLGILIDTGGKDIYIAGDGSQGSQGGVLLDLGGDDEYTGGDLSQGASVSGPLGDAHAKGVPNNGRSTLSDGAVRRTAPGLLADFGGDDKYVAGSHSQGVGRGGDFISGTNLVGTVFATGILYDEAGKDSYAVRGTSLYAQGVGSPGGLGVLFDRAGDDKYNAWGVVSQGSTVSRHYLGSNGNVTSALGLLVDLEGYDTYNTVELRGAVNRTAARADNLTRTTAGGQSSGVSTFLDAGVHLDASSGTLLGALAGTGARSPVQTDNFTLNLPSARLAVGANTPTVYEKEYAFAVDLGGTNTYRYSAAGFIADALAKTRNDADQNPIKDQAVVTLFPVSFLLDVGSAGSLYESTRALSQGAGFFSVGVLVDLGGNDTFRTLDAALPTSAAGWMPVPIIADGVVSDAEWRHAQRYTFEMTHQNDTRFVKPFTLYLGNDHENLYLRVEVPTASDTINRTRDSIVIDLDTERDANPRGVNGFTGLDEIFATPDKNCRSEDRGYNASSKSIVRDTNKLNDPLGDQDYGNDLKVGCLMSGSTITYEITRPLRETVPKDLLDLAIGFDPATGLLSRELGIRISTLEYGTSAVFTWPAMTTNVDGGLHYRKDDNLADEMRAWAGLGLANLGKAGTPPKALAPSSVSQGAAVGGVGILAMLGNSASDAKLFASERAQGYGAYGGLGVIIDAGGSDLYSVATLGQGAAESFGLGAFFELEGHDTYIGREITGFVPATTSGTGAAALFIDASGSDDYRNGAPAGTGLSTFESREYPQGNQRTWQQGQGFGIDSLSGESLRAAFDAPRGLIFGTPRTTLSITKWDRATESCTNDPVPTFQASPTIARDVVTGNVCLNADVTMGSSAFSPTTRIAGVDFLVDGIRIVADALRFGGDTSARFVIVFDATNQTDGVRVLTAAASYATTTPTGATTVYKDFATAATRPVLVNNPPVTKIALTPSFQGAAESAFSPYAAIKARTLTVDWSVSHDADEDRLELYQSWASPASKRNLPCQPSSTTLCSIVPLFFQSQKELSTTPGAGQIPAPQLQSRTQGFTHKTTTLATHLDIAKTGSFMVHLADRQALTTSSFTTNVTVALMHANGDTPVQVNGKDVILAKASITRTPPAPGLPVGAFTSTSGGSEPNSASGICAIIPECASLNPQFTSSSHTAADASGTPDWNDFAIDLDLANLQNIPGILEIREKAVRIQAGHRLSLQVLIPGPPPPQGEGPTEDFYHKNVYPGNAAVSGVCALNPSTCQQEQGLRLVDGTVRGTSVQDPVAVFFFNSPTAPSRIDVRVPTEATTISRIILENVNTGVNHTFLADALYEGDLPNGAVAPTGRRYTERLSAFDGTIEGGLIPDGLYRARIYANDSSGIETNTTRTLLLDSTAPTSRITTPAALGAPLLEGSRIPVRWSPGEFETGSSGIEGVYLYKRIGATGAFARASQTAFPSGINQFNYGPESGDVYSFLTVAVDRVGNVEGMCRPGMPTCAYTTIDQAVDAAALKKAAGTPGVSYQIVTIDRSAPTYANAIRSGGPDLEYRGSTLMFVKAGAPVRFSVDAADAGASGIGAVNITFAHVNAESGDVLTRSYAICAGNCGGRSTFSYDTWSSLNTNKALFPDGAWEVSFDIFDVASNKVQVPMGGVLLDSVAPKLVPEPVVYPGVQTAVKPGDLVRFLVRATDTFGLNEATLVLDVSAVSTDGVVRMSPTKIAGVTYYEAIVTIDRSDIDSRGYVLRVSVADLAGNGAEAFFPLEVNVKTFTIVPGTLSVAAVDHDRVTLRWNTTEPTTSYARYGENFAQLDQKAPTDTNATTEHEFTVTGLKSSTRYFFRAGSSSIAGRNIETDTIDAVTTTALFLTPKSPAVNEHVRGVVPVVFEGGLLGSSGFVTYTLEAQATRGSNYSFVTTTTERGLEHQLVFNSSRYLDGDAYMLKLTAEAGRERLSTTFGPFLSDNTPPSVVVISPQAATNSTKPTLIADIRDNLAGFHPNAVNLTIDGIGQPDVVADAITGGLSLRYTLRQDLQPGVHEFALSAVDKAGNEYVARWNVSVDGDAPVLALNAPSFNPGTKAARLGGEATLNLTVTDATGVQSVVADTSGVSSVASTRLLHVAGTKFWTGTFPVIFAGEDGVVEIPVEATDLAGNRATTVATIVVDNTAPTVAEFSTRETGHTRAIITTTASEPVLLVATASAPRSPDVTASTKVLDAQPRLVFDGLLPSRTYTYQVTVLDKAGNVVESTGRFSTSQDFTAPSGVPALTVTDLLNGTLRLTWTRATDDIGVSHYRIYRSDNGVDYQPIAETTETIHEDHGLVLERFYVYRVLAVDHGGNEGPAGQNLRASATSVPVLTEGTVSPSVGSSSTTFKYALRYQSAGGVAPKYVRIILDGAPLEMRLVGEPDYASGALYEYATRLAPHKRESPHTYSFEASDGRYTVRLFGEDAQRGPLVSGDLNAENDLGVGIASFAQNVPLGGAFGVLGAIVVAAVLAAVVVRKKKEGSK